MKLRKLLQKAINSPQNLRFTEICQLASAFGYRLDRVRGSHHIFVHPHATRPLNLQADGNKAKAYQVRQFLRDIEEFQLTMKE
ncbi:MAG: type II toxin-antitoxin system HicA family toxin [Verrucomicrobia bacterium]|nr:type II toxin-antitoxin system HicA family toxin [Verrucomicrobiota bacterium]